MSEDTATRKVRTEELADGALLRVILDAPKGNVIDGIMTAELTEVFRAAADCNGVRAVLLTAEGRHFSFGASVEEHQPDQVAAMLAGFHALFREIGKSGLPVVAAVRGMCLGGGLELAAFCHRVIAHPEAHFGQPEVTLGVFAPVASAILADRVGRGAADDLLLTGRVIDAQEGGVPPTGRRARGRPGGGGARVGRGASAPALGLVAAPRRQGRAAHLPASLRRPGGRARKPLPRRAHGHA